MSIEFRALFLCLAVLLFVLAAVDEFRGAPNRPRSFGLIAAGLACATFTVAWDAFFDAVG